MAASLGGVLHLFLEEENSDLLKLKILKQEAEISSLRRQLDELRVQLLHAHASQRNAHELKNRSNKSRSNSPEESLLSQEVARGVHHDSSARSLGDRNTTVGSERSNSSSQPLQSPPSSPTWARDTGVHVRKSGGPPENHEGISAREVATATVTEERETEVSTKDCPDVELTLSPQSHPCPRIRDQVTAQVNSSPSLVSHSDSSEHVKTEEETTGRGRSGLCVPVPHHPHDACLGPLTSFNCKPASPHVKPEPEEMLELASGGSGTRSRVLSLLREEWRAIAAKSQQQHQHCVKREQVVGASPGPLHPGLGPLLPPSAGPTGGGRGVLLGRDFFSPRPLGARPSAIGAGSPVFSFLCPQPLLGEPALRLSLPTGLGDPEPVLGARSASMPCIGHGTIGHFTAEDCSGELCLDVLESPQCSPQSDDSQGLAPGAFRPSQEGHLPDAQLNASKVSNNSRRLTAPDAVSLPSLNLGLVDERPEGSTCQLALMRPKEEPVDEGDGARLLSLSQTSHQNCTAASGFVQRPSSPFSGDDFSPDEEDGNLLVKDEAEDTSSAPTAPSLAMFGGRGRGAGLLGRKPAACPMGEQRPPIGQARSSLDLRSLLVRHTAQLVHSQRESQLASSRSPHGGAHRLKPEPQVISGPMASKGSALESSCMLAAGTTSMGKRVTTCQLGKSMARKDGIRNEAPAQASSGALREGLAVECAQPSTLALRLKELGKRGPSLRGQDLGGSKAQVLREHPQGENVTGTKALVLREQRGGPACQLPREEESTAGGKRVVEASLQDSFWHFPEDQDLSEAARIGADRRGLFFGRSSSEDSSRARSRTGAEHVEGGQLRVTVGQSGAPEGIASDVVNAASSRTAAGSDERFPVLCHSSSRTVGVGHGRRPMHRPVLGEPSGPGPGALQRIQMLVAERGQRLTGGAGAEAKERSGGCARPSLMDKLRGACASKADGALGCPGAGMLEGRPEMGVGDKRTTSIEDQRLFKRIKG